MKQQIFVDGVYDYDYEVVDDNKHTLYYSTGDNWTSYYRGKIALQIEDDGNGFKFLTKFTEKNRMDYSETEHMYILIRLTNCHNNYEIGTKRPL